MMFAKLLLAVSYVDMCGGFGRGELGAERADERELPALRLHESTLQPANTYTATQTDSTVA